MITLVHLEDWVVVYKDGKKVYENHSVDAQWILHIADVEYDVRYLDGTEFDERVSETGITPNDLSEVPNG